MARIYVLHRQRKHTYIYNWVVSAGIVYMYIGNISIINEIFISLRNPNISGCGVRRTNFNLEEEFFLTMKKRWMKLMTLSFFKKSYAIPYAPVWFHGSEPDCSRAEWHLVSQAPSP